MAKRVSRLRFTDEELESKDASRIADSADDTVGKTVSKGGVKSKSTSKGTAQVSDGVSENADAKAGKGSSKLSRAARNAPYRLASDAAHSKLSEYSDDSASANVSREVLESTEDSTRALNSVRHKLQENPHARALKAERAADRANLKALYKEAEAKNQGWGASAVSRFQQRRAIKKAYAEAKAGRTASGTAKTAGKAVRSAEKTTSKVTQFAYRHKKGLLIIGIIAMLFMMCTSILSSCSMMMGSISPTNVVSTYPSADADMLAAEAQYKGLENALQSELDNYEKTHDYDEYHYELDDIEHDPYVLISMLTAMKGGAWTIDEVSGTLQTIFDKQYILTESVETETRYKTETRTGYRTVMDPETGETSMEMYEYDVRVPYTYSICTVKLENFNMSHLPVYMMNEDRLSMYAVYMSVLGNRPDLFADSSYISKYYGEQYRYEIPTEALADEQFAAMITEAEKYLGYPYVWGGDSPSTSFDCSGFVSWVINHCGVGWSVGRRSAEGLRGICSYVSPSNAKPGDLIFFEKTYDTSGASHVGIYVGNGMMLHCGDPIHYSSINTSYWKKHFLQFGRLPSVKS